MKNVLTMALVASVLFAVSAGLSLYLNQPTKSEETASAANEKKTSKKASSASSENEPRTPKAIIQPNATADAAESAGLATQLQTDLARVAQREAELESQRELVRLVLDDLRDEMDSLNKILPKSAGNAKTSVGPGGSLAPPPIKPVGTGDGATAGGCRLRQESAHGDEHFRINARRKGRQDRRAVGQVGKVRCGRSIARQDERTAIRENPRGGRG